MASVYLGEKPLVPYGLDSLEAYRKWAKSDDYPERGRFAYLAGDLYVDLEMEQLFIHNRLKTQFTIVLGGLVDSGGLGYLFSDGVLYSSVDAELCTEPDAIFVAYETMRRGERVRMIEGADQGYVELEGAPDMVLEVVSPSSVSKDTRRLRDLYAEAGIPEYWLVDARGTELRFDILRRTARGYAAARRGPGGWVASKVFGRSFLLSRQPDPLGNPQFALAVRG